MTTNATPNAISRNALASGFSRFSGMPKPRASALRLMTFPGMSLRQVHSILRFADIGNHRFQIILRIDALPITTNAPSRPINKLRPGGSQNSRGIRFQLVSNLFARVFSRRNHHMDVIRSTGRRPKRPTAMVAMVLDHLFHRSTLLGVKQENRMFQPFASPLRKLWFGDLFAFSAFSPAAFIALQIRPVYGPRDEVCKRIVIHGGLSKCETGLDSVQQ